MTTTYEIKENVISIPLNDIIVPEKRQRKEFKNIEELAASIKERGQLTPINVNSRNMHLIAGERRLRACTLLGMTHIDAILKDVDEAKHRILEFIENKEREQLTWKELVEATKDLHDLMTSEAPDGKKWTESDTATKAGLSGGKVCTDLNLAEALEEDPEYFADCKTKEQALKMLKTKAIEDAKLELALRKKSTVYGAQAKNVIIHGNCLEVMAKLPDASIDAIISDPIFGIDFFENRFENRDKPNSFYEEHFDDSKEMFTNTMELLVPLASSKMKDNAVVLMFCGIELHPYLSSLWKKEGFQIDTLPGLWIKKGHSGRTNQPLKYFNRSYEVFMYGFRGNANMVRNRNNVFEFSGVSNYDRTHTTQKPVELLEELLSCLCLPGSIILDPMCGSGSTVIAALKKGCKPIGIEIDKTHYDNAVVEICNFLEMRDAGL